MCSSQSKYKKQERLAARNISTMLSTSPCTAAMRSSREQYFGSEAVQCLVQFLGSGVGNHQTPIEAENVSSGGRFFSMHGIFSVARVKQILQQAKKTLATEIAKLLGG